MTETVTVKWLNGMAFEADVDGYRILIDADPELGGQKRGPKPKPLMLVALAGCTGMDVVSLLKKMRVEYKKLNIIVEGNTADKHPKKFIDAKVIYELTGTNIDRDKVEKAVSLSQEKYCGVSASLKGSMELTYEIIIREEL
jgi:putative redox protein